MSNKQKKQFKPLPIPIFIVIYVAVIATCIALDQLTKHYIEIAVESHNGKIRILGDWLTFVWTTNEGATGGLFKNLGWQNWLFFAMTIIGVPVFGYLLWRSRSRGVWGQIAYSFIIGGTIGNAIDRIKFANADSGFFGGAVRDFIRVEGYFGIFNVADSFLVVGVILALVALVFLDKDSLLMTFLTERKANKEQATASNEAAEQPNVTEEIDTKDGQQPTETKTEQLDEAEHTDENS